MEVEGRVLKEDRVVWAGAREAGSTDPGLMGLAKEAASGEEGGLGVRQW